jgi:hypothetical protein
MWLHGAHVHLISLNCQKNSTTLPAPNFMKLSSIIFTPIYMEFHRIEQEVRKVEIEIYLRRYLPIFTIFSKILVAA